MKKGIALFDFDGTITSRDTLLEFIKFSKGKFHFYKGFFWNIYYLLAYKLKIISNQEAKEKIFKFFFHNMLLAEFEKQCSDFTVFVLPGLIRKKAMEEINLMKSKNYDVIVVSASPENWILNWAGNNGLVLIASKLEIKDNRLTGSLEGKNCHGTEKVRRIREKINLSDYDEIYAYGDSSGDKPMLALANKAFYKPFRK